MTEYIKYVYSDGSEGFSGQDKGKKLIYTYKLNIKKENPLSEKFLLSVEISYYDEDNKSNIVVNKIKEVGIVEDLTAMLMKEEDEDCIIESIKYICKGEEYDLLTLKDKFIFEEPAKNSIKNILKNISESGDYGLDSGLIYANILINADVSKPLVLYKVEEENDKNALNVLEQKMLKDYSSFENNVKSDIDRLQRLEIAKSDRLYPRQYILPNFSEKNHVNLYITQKEGNKLFLIDTLGSGDPNNLINNKVQTSFGKGGCCGFWISEICIELLNKKNIYEKVDFSDKANGPRLLSQLVLEAAIKVSEYIDVNNIIIKEDKSNYQKLCEIGDKTHYETYYISNNCAESKSINIEGLIEFLDSKGISINDKKKLNKISLKQKEIEKEYLKNLQSNIDVKNKSKKKGTNILEELHSAKQPEILKKQVLNKNKIELNLIKTKQKEYQNIESHLYKNNNQKKQQHDILNEVNESILEIKGVAIQEQKHLPKQK